MKNNLEKHIKQRIPFVSEYIKADVGLIYISSLLNNQHNRYFKQFDITPQQYNILRILRGQFPKAININAIKERMLDQMSDVSRILSRLEKNQLIHKGTNVFDKRNADISITELGLNLLDRIGNVFEETNDLIFKLNDEQVKQLNELIDVMLE